MRSEDPLPPSPKGSVLEVVISAVGTTYRRLAADQAVFLAATAERGLPLRSPPGCGGCCEPFVPDALPAEAAFAAAWILARDPGLGREVRAWRPGEVPTTPPCPFLRRTKDGRRCAIYPARFLICRLFGVSAVRDKRGSAEFRPCAHMPFAGEQTRGRGRSVLSGAGLSRAFGSAPPQMADYAAELVGLSPSEAGERKSILEAMPSAVARVGLGLSLAAGGGSGIL